MAVQAHDLSWGAVQNGRERIIVLARPESQAEQTTIRVAATVARQSALGVELVDAERTLEDLASYALWSGASLLCTGACSHHHRRVVTTAESLPGDLPRLVVGPRCDPDHADYRRLVAVLDGTAASDHVVDVAAWFAHRIGAELVLTEVFAPSTRAGEVPESANLRRLAKRLVPPPSTFDTLHDHYAPSGILRFVGRAGGTIIVLACHSRRHLHRLAGGVPDAVIRRATCPVLLVPQGSS